MDNGSHSCRFRIPANGRRAIWEITNQCNFACKYCIFSSSGKLPPGELSTADAKELCTNLKTAGFTHLKFTGGEPFLREDMLEIIAHAISLGLVCDISTNASSLTEEHAARLKNLGELLEQIHVSLDGATAAVNDKLRGKGAYAKTVKGVQLLISQGLRVRVGCLIHKNNEDTLQEVLEACEKLGVAEVVFSRMSAVGRLTGVNAQVSTTSDEALRKLIETLNPGKLKVTHLFGERTKVAHCPGGDKFIFINHLGRIAPCTWIADMDTEVISESVTKRPISTILQDMHNISKIAQLAPNLGIPPCFAESGSWASVKNSALLALEPTTATFGRTGKIYGFATENLDYLLGIPMAHKRVLTLGGSGDHLITSLTQGAPQVTCLDINEKARYWVELKLAALQQLDLNSFLLFMERGPNALDWDTLRTLNPGLSLEARTFWHQLLASEVTARESHIFNNSYDTKLLKVHNVPYLRSSQAYANAKEATRGHQLNWVASDIQKWTTQDKFDIVLLSNLSDYSHKMFGTGDGHSHINQFKREIVDKLLGLMPIGGVLAMYIYDYYNEFGSDKRNAFNDPKIRNSVYTGNEFNTREIKVTSACGAAADKVLILEKVGTWKG